VNLVHVSDLAAAILAALESTAMGQQYIVSDGIPRRWKEIADWSVTRGFLREYTFSGRAGRPSRQLSNQRLLTELKPSFRHTDLFREIEALESLRPHLRNDTSPAP
jgi:nucleoside-diphosphate-sugar epimerase